MPEGCERQFDEMTPQEALNAYAHLAEEMSYYFDESRRYADFASNDAESALTECGY